MKQQSAFLTVLPKEIRLQIYEHVLGNRLIHITNANTSDSKPVYTICTASQHDEDEAYYLTRSWTSSSREPISLPEWEEVYFSTSNEIWLKEYSVRHAPCLTLLRSFKAQNYDLALYKANREGYAVENEIPESGLPLYQRRCRIGVCPGFPRVGIGRPCEHLKDLMMRFGQPSGKAFRRLHPDSFLEMSDLLVVCRQVYEEARLVPFTSNEFVLHIENTKELDALFEIAQASFRPWQLSAIQHIAIQGSGGTSPSGFDIRLVHQATKLLPGVQRLSISTNCPPGTNLAGFLLEDAVNHNIKLPLVSRAKVIVGHDNPSAWRSRVERRGQAERVERLLTRGLLEDEQDSDGDEEGEVRMPDLEEQLEGLHIPKLPYPRGPVFMSHGKYNRSFGAGN